MSDPREKLSPAESKPTAPRLDIPVRPPPGTPPASDKRTAVPGHEVRQIAQALAAGASWPSVLAFFEGISDAWWVANRASLEARAARESPVPLPTREQLEQAERDADRLDRLFGRVRPDDGAPTAFRFKVKRAIGR